MPFALECRMGSNPGALPRPRCPDTGRWSYDTHQRTCLWRQTPPPVRPGSGAAVLSPCHLLGLGSWPEDCRDCSAILFLVW